MEGILLLIHERIIKIVLYASVGWDFFRHQRQKGVS